MFVTRLVNYENAGGRIKLACTHIDVAGTTIVVRHGCSTIQALRKTTNVELPWQPTCLVIMHHDLCPQRTLLALDIVMPKQIKSISISSGEFDAN